MQIKNDNNIDPLFLKLHERYNEQRQESVESNKNTELWQSRISVTELINPPQIGILKKYNDHRINKQLNDLLPSILGNSLHEALSLTFDTENYPNDHREIRLFQQYKDFDDPQLSGQPDRIFQETSKTRNFKNVGTVWVKGEWCIQDYKFTGAYSTYKPKQEWVEQLNCYAYLVRKGVDKYGDGLGIKIDRLFVTAIVRDWNSRNVGKPDYPESWVVDIDIPLWTEEEQEQFIKDKMLIYKEAEIAYTETNYDSSQLPKCTDDDRWSSGGGHAVMKPSRKTAVKLFDSEREAQEFAQTISGAYVESRPVTYTRCDRYCDVSNFCHQLRSEYDKEK